MFNFSAKCQNRSECRIHFEKEGMTRLGFNQGVGVSVQTVKSIKLIKLRGNVKLTKILDWIFGINTNINILSANSLLWTKFQLMFAIWVKSNHYLNVKAVKSLKILGLVFEIDHCANCQIHQNSIKMLKFECEISNCWK